MSDLSFVCPFNKIHNNSCFIVHNHVQYSYLLNKFTDEVPVMLKIV